MKRKVTLCLTTLLLAALAGACLLPQSRSFISIGLYLIRGQTGTLVYYDNRKGFKHQDYYSQGLREGIWRVWDKSGNLASQCEYRNNHPWDGVCQLVDNKSWFGEYKNGQPWNGYIPKAVDGYYEQPEGWGYFIDCKELTYSEYNSRRGKPGSKSVFWGLHTLGIQNTNENSSVNH